MAVSRMSASVSFLARWISLKNKMSVRSLLLSGRQTLKILCAGLCIECIAYGYTTVQMSTGAPAGLEASFIAATTSQFNAKVITNPFFPGTYQIMLYGQNPNYVAVSTSTCFNLAVNISTGDLQSDLNALISSGAQIIRDPYVYGWAAGMQYDRSLTTECLSQVAGNCGFPSKFQLLQTSTSTFDSSTCQDTVSNLAVQIYQLNYSTPTLGGF